MCTYESSDSKLICKQFLQNMQDAFLEKKWQEHFLQKACTLTCPKLVFESSPPLKIDISQVELNSIEPCTTHTKLNTFKTRAKAYPQLLSNYLIIRVLQERNHSLNIIFPVTYSHHITYCHHTIAEYITLKIYFCYLGRENDACTSCPKMPLDLLFKKTFLHINIEKQVPILLTSLKATHITQWPKSALICRTNGLKGILFISSAAV